MHYLLFMKSKNLKRHVAKTKDSDAPKNFDLPDLQNYHK